MAGLRTPIQSIVIDALIGISGLFPSPFPGGINDTLPKAGSGGTATPDMFYDSSNALEAGLLKPLISVLDGGDNPAPNGAVRNGYVQFPLVYAFVTPDSAGASALATLDSKLQTLFRRGVSYLLVNGVGPEQVSSVEIVVLERQILRDGEDFGTPNRKFAIWRLQATYLKRLPN
jgi:hypothetical protein